jgi:hypothetical protein
MADNDFLDLSALAQVAENIPDEAVEAVDYNPFPTTPPGKYLSISRVITGRQRDDGHFTFQIALAGGITPVDGGRTYEKSDKYPLTDRKISTKSFQDGDRGITSGAAKYLRACGFDVKGLKAADIPALMQESQLIPVGVVIGRGVKAVETENGWETPFIHRDGSGVTYATGFNPDKKTLREVRTSDFRDAEGNVANTYTDANGRVWDSKATVDGYFQIK